MVRLGLELDIEQEALRFHVVIMSNVGTRRHMMSHTSTSGTEPSSA